MPTVTAIMEPAEGLTGDRFVVFLQNHDQVGNRASGERLNVLLGSEAKQRLAASLLLLSPYVPLLFMGEEYGEDNPFPFFCSFRAPELIEAVRVGRKQQFADPDDRPVPDPVSEATFASARLSWSWPEGTFRAGLRRLYRDLLAARREWPACEISRIAAARIRLDRKGASFWSSVAARARRIACRSSSIWASNRRNCRELCEPARAGGYSARNHPRMPVLDRGGPGRHRFCRGNVLC